MSNSNSESGPLSNGQQQQHPDSDHQQQKQEEGSHSHSHSHSNDDHEDETMEEAEEEEEEDDDKENDAQKQSGDGEDDARQRSNVTGTPKASSQSTTPNKSRTPQSKKASLNALSFPFTRVKRLIKSDPDTRVSSEAAYIITKGVELFLEKFVEQSFEYMIDDRRHSLTYKDLASNVSRTKRLHFLSDFVPEKVTAAFALEQVKEEE